MMKKWMKRGCFPVLVFACLLMLGLQAKAESNDVIKKGIFAGDVELSGMDAAQAEAGTSSSPLKGSRWRACGMWKSRCWPPGTPRCP